MEMLNVLGFFEISKTLQDIIEDPGKIIENLKLIAKSPVVLITLLGIIVLIVLLTKVRKVKFDSKVITYVAVAVALSAILSFIKIYKLPMGGSVTLGSMIPILILAFAYGSEVGFIAGLVLGLVNLVIDPYILHPVQVLFDYILPFMILGIAGYFKNKQLGIVAAVVGRFIFHFLSGVIFFAEYAGDMNPYIYSILYNGTYLVPEMIISIVIISVVPIERIFHKRKSKYA
ncbi:energy-coupled thiamine transporter ThiT [Clostridium cellulovorans]|uniref:Proton-coupled thiamine transporter YuaJ n=1 Tax=Clostridium cellulovorans (strain ATCC 35296 / DSM 3052 / OCM 3 / 743B) TaxID=573061 RepID=D9SNM3_CLOC7|nr:energy-coupled thiamine transporter ThiT [Clostridium cellulovorans]ADL49894.1 proton-coupled thiamine transporter YuaJ [Clostridium cellulovorans 743B]